MWTILTSISPPDSATESLIYLKDRGDEELVMKLHWDKVEKIQEDQKRQELSRQFQTRDVTRVIQAMKQDIKNEEWYPQHHQLETKDRQ